MLCPTKVARWCWGVLIFERGCFNLNGGYLNLIEPIRGMDEELDKVQISSISSLNQKLDTIWRRVSAVICNNLDKLMQKRCKSSKKAHTENKMS